MNILIIEDDAASRMLLEKLLNSMGHQVKSTGAVLPAFEMIRKGDLDLIMMDIRLPGLSGISFTRKLRTYPEFRDIPDTRRIRPNTTRSGPGAMPTSKNRSIRDPWRPRSRR
jgi:CheY-like chemotaxis protein